ncbi:valine--tRNA ligase [Chlamydiifrater phoenicopteri]|uniref:valine--tRNA ligase n=1 Tax=Chlamydiifrater phoenicopteri TaxID=2681469 RepID=UPI001BCCB82D|nr:valine--tRNA ligase [Chlamydiifrater phoenicopteri]
MKKEELSKAYSAVLVEERLYAFWESAGLFKANAESSKPPFSVIMPPPNVTGVLHMGHALVNTLQDIVVRYKRKTGFEVCWIPGTDHAGIATQSVVEKHLLASEGKRRRDYSRQEFLEKVEAWKERSQQVILSQLRKLGCSCDWSRQRFTMDAGANAAVRKAFKILFDKGLIYQGDYLVNWDPVLQTALADDEVEHEEKKGYLYYFNYPIVGDRDGRVVSVATTRPETLLGDVAVAVSPEDERYQDLLGVKLYHPLLEKEIPLIFDVRVDQNFGTGAVKITPAHDKDDYRIGVDHGLPLINILTPEGLINDNGGKFCGLTREEAREKVTEAMKSLGRFEKKEDYAVRTGVSYRSGAVVEPFLSKQWFVRAEPFIGKLRSVAEEQLVKLFPPEFKQNYLSWVNNLRDWCISRQLWWGHQIPIWYKKGEESTVICYDGEGVPPEVAENPHEWEQDPDVLDTWFSSGLWPITCLGWPDLNSKDLAKFYPTSFLVTGHDILFFWVTRMILMCSEFSEGEVPFKEVFLHGLIFGKSYFRFDELGQVTYITGEEKKSYDSGSVIPKDVCHKWEKLSKSKGNVVDPLDLIASYGADAIRMTLCSFANRGEQIDLDYRVFEEFKNFSNKIWNGARFILGNIEGLKAEDIEEGIDSSLLGVEDYQVMYRFNELVSLLHEYYTNYSFDKIATRAYEFFRNDLCSTYIELIKPVLFNKLGTDLEKRNKQKLLVCLLAGVLGVLHPMAPFITEELFQKLKQSLGKENYEGGDDYTRSTCRALSAISCMTASYPEAFPERGFPEDLLHRCALRDRLVYIVRNIRSESGISPGEAVKVYIASLEYGHLQEHATALRSLAGVGELFFVEALPKDEVLSIGVVEHISVGVVVSRELLKKETDRLRKDLSKLEASLERNLALLANQEFISKAKAELISEKKEMVDKQKAEVAKIREKLIEKEKQQ